MKKLLCQNLVGVADLKSLYLNFGYFFNHLSIQNIRETKFLKICSLLIAAIFFYSSCVNDLKTTYSLMNYNSIESYSYEFIKVADEYVAKNGLKNPEELYIALNDYSQKSIK